jgi:hypothetical protein
MSFRGEIRSGKGHPDRFSLYALIFWLGAGSIAGVGLAVDLAGQSAATRLALILALATIGSCGGFDGAFGGGGWAGVVARAGWPRAVIGMLVGLQ